MPNDNDARVYAVGFMITAGLTFIVSYIYCIVEYGYLWGVGFGWLPSIIVALVIGALWPLVVLGLIVGVIFVVLSNR
ncbi:hypothetical protein ACO2I3_01060 [Leptospira interrogans]